MRDFPPRASAPHSAFSLTEVVVALGIVSFVVIGIIGLYAVGLKTGSESLETTSAANLTSLILGQRRVTPADGTNGLPNFALPGIDQTGGNFDPATGVVNTPVYVGADGYRTTPASASYGLLYTVTALERSSRVYLLLYWPPQAPVTNAAGRYEVATQIALP